MEPGRKREVIELVRRSPVEKKQTLFELGLSASTYYRWQRRYREQGEAGLVDRRPQPGTVWNRMKPEEEKAILGAAWVGHSSLKTTSKYSHFTREFRKEIASRLG